MQTRRQFKRIQPNQATRLRLHLMGKGMVITDHLSPLAPLGAPGCVIGEMLH